jgi:hypothetical protein
MPVCAHAPGNPKLLEVHAGGRALMIFDRLFGGRLVVDWR